MPRSMKDGLGAEAIQRIIKGLVAVDPGFPRTSFARAANKGIQGLELRQRVDVLIGLLAEYLPTDFAEAADLLEQVPEYWDGGDDNDPLRGFAAWPIIDFVGHRGLNEPQRALALLKRLTPLFSAEFAIRPFLQQHTELTLTELRQWCSDPDEHVRRLVSEGSRPKLPWGRWLGQFVKDPSPLFDLLELLKDDPSEYVRRSVANNLNDIAKDHPRLVIDLCTHWKTDADSNQQWIIQHATRTLVKQGIPAVYPLLGYTQNPKVVVKHLTVNLHSNLTRDLH